MQQANSEQPQRSTTETLVNVSQNERRLSTLGGALLLLASLQNKRKFRFGIATAGATLLYRGLTGISPIYKLMNKNTAIHSREASISVPHQQGVHVSQSITISCTVEEVYTFWRDFNNLPRFIPQLKTVEVQDNTHSHWKLAGLVGMTIEWDAEIINDEPNSVIGWRSLQNPYVDHAGSVRFKTAPGDQGTEVRVEMEYRPIAGVVGTALAWLAGNAPEEQTYEALQHLKQILEVGEVTTIEGQSSGRAEVKA
ncbi:MAG: SRPBCC family protein [Aggregatilineales bacterium]